jgi:hypothetical protein
MYNYDLSQFSKLVKGTSSRYKTDSVVSLEDVEQECWLKIVENMPRVQQIPPKEVDQFVFVMLRNHVSSMKNASMRRANLNIHLRYEEEDLPELDDNDPLTIDDIMDRAIVSLDASIPEHRMSQEQVYSYQELVKRLLLWSNGKTGKAPQFVKEMVDPSEETLKTWNGMVEKHPYLKSFHSIPPASFAKIIGCSKTTIARIISDLREYLDDFEYEHNTVLQLTY